MDAVGSAVGDRSGVPELASDLRTGRVNRLGQAGQARRRFGVNNDDFLVGAAPRSYCQVGDCCQPDAAVSRFEVIVDQLIGDRGVRPSKVAALITRLRSRTGPRLTGSKMLFTAMET